MTRRSLLSCLVALAATAAVRSSVLFGRIRGQPPCYRPDPVNLDRARTLRAAVIKRQQWER